MIFIQEYWKLVWDGRWKDLSMGWSVLGKGLSHCLPLHFSHLTLDANRTLVNHKAR